MSHYVVISLGSNLPSRASLIGEATKRLAAQVGVEWRSAELESPDIDGSDAVYANIVLRGVTHHNLSRLEEICKAIERDLGRSDGPLVAIDIDIVVFDGRVVRPKVYDAAYFRELIAEAEPSSRYPC